jgi:hypothetical protein
MTGAVDSGKGVTMQVQHMCRLLLIGNFGSKRAVGITSVTCRYHVGALRTVCFGRVNQVLAICLQWCEWGVNNGANGEVRKIGAT